MAKLSENSTVEQVKEFLLDVMDEADDRQAKTNQSLTKKQVWDINMGYFINKNDASVCKTMMIAIKNLNKEFGY